MWFAITVISLDLWSLPTLIPNLSPWAIFIIIFLIYPIRDAILPVSQHLLSKMKVRILLFLLSLRSYVVHNISAYVPINFLPIKLNLSVWAHHCVICLQREVAKETRGARVSMQRQQTVEANFMPQDIREWGFDSICLVLLCPLPPSTPKLSNGKKYHWNLFSAEKNLSRHLDIWLLSIFFTIRKNSLLGNSQRETKMKAQKSNSLY